MKLLKPVQNWRLDYYQPTNLTGVKQFQYFYPLFCSLYFIFFNDIIGKPNQTRIDTSSDWNVQFSGSTSGLTSKALVTINATKGCISSYQVTTH